MENKFLAVNKNYFHMGLKSIDLLIISQIEEFKRNSCECYVTNEQLADMFGESKDTIKRALTRLEKQNVIKRNTTVVKGNGRANKQRTLSVNPVAQWKINIIDKIVFDEEMQEDIDSGLVLFDDFYTDHADYFAEELAQWGNNITFNVTADTIYCLDVEGVICSECTV